MKENEILSYENILEAKNMCKIENIDEDSLYDEISLLSTVFAKLKHDAPTSFQEMHLHKLWVKVFETSEFTELPKILSKVLSVPVSNAYVERVFSIMNNLWTDERNLMRTDLVKAELCTKLNFDMSCQEFLEFITREDQNALLACCQNTKKYNFKSK